MNKKLNQNSAKRFCIMGRLRERLHDTKQGASLVIVICVSAFLAAFALALVYTAGMLLFRANQRLRQERCLQQARSFAQVLEEELTRYTTPVRTGTPAGETPPAKDKSFYEFACKFLEGVYGEYNPDHPEETTYYYSVSTSSAGPEYGEIQVILYKEEGQDEMAGEILFDMSKGTTNTGQDPMDYLKGQQISRYVLTVEVVATLDGVTCHYSTSYQQKASYREDAILCRAPDDRIIIWNKTGGTGEWKYTDGTSYGGGGAETVQIRYEIQEGFNNLTKCEFAKTIEEVGDSP